MVLYNGWTLGWDGENRLKSASKGSTNISYAYDALNRRISETKGTNTTHFTWDGYNLFHEITLSAGGSTVAEKSYVWGLDLSGTMQGAGGVGGLLWQDDNITHEKSFALYDNNGNITKYIKPDYTLGANYNYDAFLNGSTGTAYRFQASTKSWNNDLGLLDYQFRAYSPTLGRWIQEDPIEEQGGNNLYAFVGNNPVNRWDNWGLWLPSRHKSITKNAFARILMTTISDSNLKSEKVKEKLIEIVKTANVDTDSNSTTKSDQRYHYCRDMETSENIGRTGYSTILKKLKDKFEELLIVAGDTPETSCAKALVPLGTLTHVWQDYYAHGVEQDDSWYGAKIGYITGNPEALTMIPVSFSELGFRGGHGGFFRLVNPWSKVEPGDRAPDRTMRIIKAQDFTAVKLVDYINLWLPSCKCEYEKW